MIHMLLFLFALLFFLFCDTEGIEDYLNDIYEESESDLSELESHRSSKSTAALRSEQIIESVGPPKILKYVPEAKGASALTNLSRSASSTSSCLSNEKVNDLGQFMKDFNVYIEGGNACEFCGQLTKPWPTRQQQEELSPNEVRTAMCTLEQTF
jgi:hypothetical protein